MIKPWHGKEYDTQWQGDLQPQKVIGTHIHMCKPILWIAIRSDHQLNGEYSFLPSQRSIPYRLLLLSSVLAVHTILSMRILVWVGRHCVNPKQPIFNGPQQNRKTKNIGLEKQTIIYKYGAHWPALFEFVTVFGARKLARFSKWPLCCWCRMVLNGVE